MVLIQESVTAKCYEALAKDAEPGGCAGIERLPRPVLEARR